MLLKIVQTSHAADKIRVCYGFLSLAGVIFLCSTRLSFKFSLMWPGSDILYCNVNISEMRDAE